MSVARRASNRQPIRADAATDDIAPFECFSCRVPVDHVNSFWVRKDNPDLAREVKAFFRLKGSYEHASGCANIPGAQLKELVRRAEAVEDSVNPFEKDPNRDIWVFRLNIPAEEEAREIASDPSLQAASIAVRTERVWNGKSLENFCRSAVGLAKLWRKLESPFSQEAQSELRTKVRIAVTGKLIVWEEFFYSEKSMNVLADRLQANALNYPVALLLCVKNVKEVHNRKFIVFSHVISKNLESDTYIVVEASGNWNVLRDFNIGCHYIVFGKFYYSKTNLWHPKGRSTPIVFRDIRLRIFRRSQYDLIEAFERSAD